MAGRQRDKQDLIDLFSKVLEGSLYDDQSTTNEEYASGLLKAHTQIVSRNVLLTKLLESYIDSHSKKVKENRLYKGVMFIIFLLAFISFTAATLCLFLKTDISTADIPQVVSLLSVGATYIGSIFVAYEIMFKYLFPTDEEKDMISMIKTVIENDLKVEEFTSSRLAGRIAKLEGDSNQDDSDS